MEVMKECQRSKVNILCKGMRRDKYFTIQSRDTIMIQ